MTHERIGLLYMYGPIGSGKTSIMRRLYEQLHLEERYNVQLLFAPNVKTANAFLRLVMDAFGVTTNHAYTQSLKNFEVFLLDQYQTKRVPVLLTEDAYKELFVASKGLPRDAIKTADETPRLLYLTRHQRADGAQIQQIARELNLSA